MPEVDGYKFVQEIRQHETGSKHIPVIAIKAYAQKEDAQKCLSAGCNAYLLKPLKRDVLFSKIQEVA